MQHTVVISDIHLCEAEQESGLWMRYRQPACSPAPQIAAMLAALRRPVGRDPLCVVLNGDVFDFDAPRVIDNTSVFHDLPRDARNATTALAAILGDHPAFVGALGELLADGSSVVFVCGNHDVQLTLPEVRDLLADHLTEAGLAALARRHAGLDGEPACSGSGSGDARAAIRSRILFRAWFHRTEDGIVIEHGHQYDPYCAYREPAAPFGRDGRTIQPTLGSLVSRHLASRMGYFNPHVDDSHELSIGGYLVHWARYYALSNRSLIGAWMIGALRTVFGLASGRLPGTRARRRESIARAARESGASLLAVARHARLCAGPVEDRLHLAVRILWLDRAALFALATIALVLGLIGLKGALLAAVAALLLLASYEVFAPRETFDAVWRRVQRAARQVAAIHRARAVVFGHTHHAEGAWEDGVFYGNSGSWSAAFRDLACTQPLLDRRLFIWLRSEGGMLEGGLTQWKDGRIEPAVEEARAGAPRPTRAKAPPRRWMPAPAAPADAP